MTALSNVQWQQYFQTLQETCSSYTGSKKVQRFNKDLYQAAKQINKNYPWRANRTPYRVLVAELMLQQTQADRVAPLYRRFLAAFPSIKKLAHAEQREVIAHWQGLGYNRRALFLHRLASIVHKERAGRIPRTQKELIALPGIGAYTSRSILVFAHNQPEVFIETNIRSMFLYFFTPLQRTYSDEELLVHIEATIDRNNPRRWYEALMDVGSVLKKHVPKLNTFSQHYQKQSKFEGSFRQKRGLILKQLLHAGEMSKTSLQKQLHIKPAELEKVLLSLTADAFIENSNGRVRLR